MSRRNALVIVMVLTLGGFALRLYYLGRVPFRGDEAFAAQYWAGQPLAASLAQTATIEPHPILTYAIFRAWGVTVGINEFTLRLLPTLFNILAIPAIFALGCRLDGRVLGVFAAFLWAVNPYQIWHSQDARNYAIWVGMSAVSMWLALRVIERRRGVDWLLYGVAAVIAVFTFYLELFLIGALSLFGLIVQWHNWRFVRSWIVLHVLIAAAAATSFLLLQGGLFQRGGYGGTIGTVNLSLFLPTLVFGNTFPQGVAQVLTPILLLLFVVGLGLWRRGTKSGLFVLLLGVVPPLLLLATSLKLDVLHPRYILPVMVVGMLVFAGTVIRLWQGNKHPSSVLRILAMSLAVGWVGMSVYSLYGYFFVNDYAKSKDWPALTDYLSHNVQADDLVIQTGVDAAFGYYYNAPALDIGLPKNPQQTVDEIIQTLNQSQKAYRSLWAVGSTFPDWPNAGIVEAWLGENMQRVRSTSIDGLPAQQFMTWEVHPDELASSPIAVFDNLAELVGVQVYETPEPTGELTIWLYWKPLGITETQLKVFVHLVGATNPVTGTPLWTQDDQLPQDGRINTHSWLLGTTYRDVYSLPMLDVPGGEYEIVVGWYNPETNERVMVDGDDSYLVGHVTIGRPVRPPLQPKASRVLPHTVEFGLPFGDKFVVDVLRDFAVHQFYI